jgi:hypothetical protein
VEVRLLLALLALFGSGCGRFEFGGVPDAAPDTPIDSSAIGHDEDGDGILDPQDPCPHVAGGIADQDSDGVGDACDPNPAIGTEHYLVFSTLAPGDHPFDSLDGFVQEADSVRYTGDNANLRISRPLATVRIEVGFEIHALFGSGQHQVASGIDRTSPPNDPYYFVELNENGAVHKLGVISYDPVNQYQSLGAVDHNGMHAGRGLLQYDAIATTPRGWRVTAGWIGELYQTGAATAAYDGGDAIRLTFNGLDLSLRYVVIIETL